MASQLVFVSIVLVLISSFCNVACIKCYQCSGTDSSNPFECNEYLDSDTDLEPIDCDNIHDAQFCIKHVGRYEGKQGLIFGRGSSSTIMNVLAIECYQCNSSSTMECGDGLMNLDGGVLTPTSCEHVYNAQFCIKHTGGISTKRYCSALDLGNICNYVQQPGDTLEYRTCIYTCSTDGCNGAAYTTLSIVCLGVLGLISFLI